MNSIPRWACIAVALLILSGCSGLGGDDLPATVDAEGTLTLDGEPIAGASIVFVADGGQYPAFAHSEESGKFALKAFEAKDGAVPGSYKVQVTRTIELEGGEIPDASMLGEDAEHMSEEEKAGVTWVNDLPKKYQNPNDSGLVVVIPEGGITNIDLSLTSGE